MALLEINIKCAACNSLLDGATNFQGEIRVDPCERCKAAAIEEVFGVEVVPVMEVPTPKGEEGQA